MLERSFQKSLIAELKNRFEGCVVLKNDARYLQGIPDLSVFYKDKWAVLECKDSKSASKRPNQDYYISKMDKMSFGRFIYPENREEVLSDLSDYFKSGR